MEIKRYEEIVKKHKPKENRVKNALIAFLVGGSIGIIAEVLTNIYTIIFHMPSKDASGLMLITIIFVACLFTALGFFDKLVTFARCGLIIPITGFAHSMQSAALEYKKEGPIYGIGSNIFKLSGSVILYGIVSAWLFGIIRFFIIGG